MQKLMHVVVCFWSHLRVSVLAERYLLPEASHPTIALGNEEFNWQFKGCAFAIQLAMYLGTSWDHYPVKPGPLPVDLSVDVRCLWKVSISPIPLSHPPVFTVINYCRSFVVHSPCELENNALWGLAPAGSSGGPGDLWGVLEGDPSTSAR